MLSLIVAMADNGVIGRNNQMPWHIPEDFKYFKRRTMGKPIIMGRKTFESLGRVLPGRPHVVISRNADYPLPENCYLAGDLKQGVAIASSLLTENQQEAVIIGGSQIYKEAIALVDTLYITEVHLNPEGDAFFPAIDLTVWQETERTELPGKIKGSFVTYIRRTH
ncbi:MAG: dihydrofolate reductase [Gammaproteobacteria bacterium]|nr:MAG: dihydrofolate reductase [Gammaproteobacteria bacterium]